MSDHEKPWVQLGRSIDDLPPMEELLIALLATVPPDRLRRVVDEAISLHTLRIQLELIECGEDPESE